MANIEVQINAINMRDFKRQLQEWCEELQVTPQVSPDELLQSIDLDSLRIHLEDRLKEQGFTLDIKAMIDEVVEVKAPKRARKEKAPELVLMVDEDDPKLEAIKEAVIRKMTNIYLEPAGKAHIDGIMASYGVKKMREIPASAFPAIAEELEEKYE
jgi:aryl carrier-like protein